MKLLEPHSSPKPSKRHTAPFFVTVLILGSILVIAVLDISGAMRPLSIVSLIVLAISPPPVSGTPFTFPLSNGFPFPNESALENLFTVAGGNFTNAPLAPKFDNDSLTSWKLQAFNEFFEVAFFTQLINNITERKLGFELDQEIEGNVLASLTAIQAQEEMHAYNANDAVRYFTGGSHIFPCAYVFPGVHDFPSAIALAQTFTDMYIGLLIEIQRRTAASLGSLSSSIIYVLAQALGQEGQQSGWFRSLLGKHASAEPFLSSNTRDLHFSWLQRFIVPGSCPNMGDIPIETFQPLELASAVHGAGPISLRLKAEVDATKQRVAFINGALVPTVVPFEVTSVQYGANASVTSEITANFPFAHNVMHGLTLVTVVENRNGFVSAIDVANATLWGPAVIELA
ncbi:hypothetical protein KCU92_g9109, partial [Aureobasidium melanogenum]